MISLKFKEKSRNFHKNIIDMKKEEIKNNDEHITEEELLEINNFFKEHQGEIFFKEKYFKSQKSTLIVDTKELYEKAPDLPLKKVILTLMEPLPDFLPADNLVEVTKIITECWTELSKKAAA